MKDIDYSKMTQPEYETFRSGRVGMYLTFEHDELHPTDVNAIATVGDPYYGYSDTEQKAMRIWEAESEQNAAMAAEHRATCHDTPEKIDIGPRAEIVVDSGMLLNGVRRGSAMRMVA